MRIKYLFLLIILTGFWTGCKDSELDSPSIDLSESEFNDVSNEGATLKLEITTGSTWTASSDVDWCRPLPEKGTGNQSLTIAVEGNLETTQRTATVAIVSGGTEKKIQIHQNAATGELHYKLPVIFHVLYKDQSDRLQYVSQSRLAEILTVVNKLYNDNAKSVDMNLSFVLAESDPDGNALSTPGVEYIQYTEEYPIDCEEFMTDKSGKNVGYLWDPNRYINVMVYNFKVNPASKSTILGISHIPFSTVGGNFLEGLSETQQAHLELGNLKFPYSVSVNSLYINVQSTSTVHSPNDVTVTMAHELGHYLGLHHVFSEDMQGTVNDCIDSDYCDDTPTYNKVYYDEWLGMQTAVGIRLLSKLAVRENCQTGQQFISNNIMDYAYSYTNRFTDDQRDRIRHVLTYSPLIPGPKKGVTKTRSAAATPLDLPIRVVK